MSSTKILPILCECLNCKSKVFQFEDFTWGCDTCKSVWTYRDKAWTNIGNKKKRNLKSLLNRKL